MSYLENCLVCFPGGFPPALWHPASCHQWINAQVMREWFAEPSPARWLIHYVRPTWASNLYVVGGRGGTRTLMPLRAQDPEPCVSTNSTTRPLDPHPLIEMRYVF